MVVIPFCETGDIRFFEVEPQAAAGRSGQNQYRELQPDSQCPPRCCWSEI